MKVFVTGTICLLGTANVVYSKTFGRLTYSDIETQLLQIANDYPDLVNITTAQEEFGIDYQYGDCSWVDSNDDDDDILAKWDAGASLDDCEKIPTYIVYLGKFDMHDEYTPEIYLSGALHGSERVGPPAVTEFIEFAVKSYSGEGPDANNIWIKHLLETRSFVITPMTNSQGYSYRQRREYLTPAPTESNTSQDPNRDFPMAAEDGCFRTVTARTVNELFRRHIFPISLTFHANLHFVGLPWGTPMFPEGAIAPDDQVSSPILATLSHYSGGELGEYGEYHHGRLSDVGPTVPGGMEDWAYGASFVDGAVDPTCLNRTDVGRSYLSPYPVERLQYSDGMLRSLCALVETSIPGEPSSKYYGTDESVLSKSKSEGFIPKNIRTILAAADLLQPYIKFAPKLPGTPLQCVASTSFPKDAESSSSTVGKVNPGVQVALSFEVGGSIHVDSAQLVGGKWPTDMNGLDATKPAFGIVGDEAITQKLKPDEFSSDGGTGFTRIAGARRGGEELLGFDGIYSPSFRIDNFKSEPRNAESDRKSFPFIGAHQVCFTAPSEPGEYYFLVQVQVDQKFKDKVKDAVPDIGPQSHLANMRTNPDWNHEVGGHRVRGQVRYYSVPFKLTVADAKLQECECEEKDSCSELFGCKIDWDVENEEGPSCAGQYQRRPEGWFKESCEGASSAAGSWTTESIIGATAGATLVTTLAGVAVALSLSKGSKTNQITSEEVTALNPKYSHT